MSEIYLLIEAYNFQNFQQEATQLLAVRSSK